MNRVSRQTVDDIQRLVNIHNQTLRSDFSAFFQAELIPYLKTILKGFFIVVFVGICLHAPTWMADRERNPFSWTMNTQILQLLVAIYATTVVVTFIIYMKNQEHDPEFLRYRALRLAFDKLSPKRQSAILGALETANKTGVMPYDTFDVRHLRELLRVARSVRLKQV